MTAYVRYGKGTGQPAQLNLGDCFSYAMSKRAGLALLYNGDDFKKTDIGQLAIGIRLAASRFAPQQEADC